MISEPALQIVLAIREMEGPNVKGVGPELEVLMKHKYVSDLSPEEFLNGIEDAEQMGFVNVARGIGKNRKNIPNKPVELRAIIGVSILEAGQEYIDSLGL